MQTIIFSDVLAPGYGKNAGAYRIASELRSTGFTCQVVDFFAHFSINQIYSIIDTLVTDDTIWVGFSTTFFLMLDESIDAVNQTPNEKAETIFLDKLPFPVIDSKTGYPFDALIMKDIFSYIRSKNSKVKIVIGGGRSKQASTHDASIFNKVWGDYYVHGFADDSIKVLTKWLSDKSNTEPKFSGWANNFIDSNKEYDYQNFNRSTLHFEKNDVIDSTEFIPIEIARGCIFKCKFCCFPLLGKKRGDYTKTKETLQEEFIRNYETFGTTHYMFMDETINDSMEKVEFLYDVISTLPFKIKWGGYQRLDLYYSNPEMASIIQEIGCEQAIFGIETLNKKTGEAVGKGMHPDKVKELLKKLKNQWKENIHLSSGFIIGLPYETKESLKNLEIYLLSDDCGLDSWSLYPFLIIEGTDTIISGNPKQYGYEIIDAEYGTEWQNEYMNFTEAYQITTEIRKNTMHKCKVNGWMQMRLRNVGYTKDEMNSMTVFDYYNNMIEIQRRLTLKKENYLSVLMGNKEIDSK